MRKTLTVVAAFALIATSAQAQAQDCGTQPFAPMRARPFKRKARMVPATAVYYQVTPCVVPMASCVAVTVAPSAQASTVVPAPAPSSRVATTTDATAFVAWLNQTRAAHGLTPVGYDPALDGECQQNNYHQAAWGLGHFVMGRSRRQNAAMGGFPGVESMWMASYPHRVALLDPTITFVGIAWYGSWCTFSAY